MCKNSEESVGILTPELAMDLLEERTRNIEKLIRVCEVLAEMPDIGYEATKSCFDTIAQLKEQLNKPDEAIKALKNVAMGKTICKVRD